MQSFDILKKNIINIITELQGRDIMCFNMYGKSNIADIMIICTGNSNRHVISITQDILQKSRDIGFKSYSVEGIKTGEWVLVDLGDLIIHIMQKETRKLYALEKLWS